MPSTYKKVISGVWGHKKAIAGVCSAVLLFCSASAQVTGGQYAFEYLRLSNSPNVSAQGGISVANPGEDISFALQNPAMMRPGLHNQLELNDNIYYAGINIMNLAYGYNVPSVNTSFFFGVQYLNYGAVTQTDAIGNVEGTFHPVDYAVTLGASRSYLEHWRYGADVKLAHSSLFMGNAGAAMVDVGINYYDTSSLWDFGAVAKNMGVMLKKYDVVNPAEPIPFDLQLGLSKRFKHVPLRLFTTIHHLYEWDIRYNNPADLTSSSTFGNTDTADTKAHVSDKIFRHFIFGAELSIGKSITVTGSYNDMRRRELVVDTHPGVAGFAFGLGIHLKKFNINYARSYYSIVGAYNEIGITMALNKLFGLAMTGEKIHWNAEYPDWE